MPFNKDITYLRDESVGVADVEPLAGLLDVEAVPFRVGIGIVSGCYGCRVVVSEERKGQDQRKRGAGANQDQGRSERRKKSTT